MFERLETLGLASVEAFWLPVLAWTLIWGGVVLALRLELVRGAASRYRIAQAALLVLPVGLAMASVLDVTAWVPSVLPTFDPAPALSASLPTTPPPVLSDLPAVASSRPALSMAAALGGLGVGLLMVALVQLLRFGAQVGAVWRLRRALPRVTDRQLEADVRAARAMVGLRRPVRVQVTSAAIVPVTLGMWRPVVVVPHTLRGRGRRMALAHEFLHVRQLDPLMQALESLVASLFGWHPAVRRLARQTDLLREMACDAHLLADASVSRSAYATLLASFLTPPAPSAVPVGLGLADSLPDVHQRLLAMRTSSLSRPSTPLGWILVLALLIGGSLTMTAGRALAQQSFSERQRVVKAESVERAAEAEGRVISQADQLVRQLVGRADAAENEAAQVRVGTVRRLTEAEREVAIEGELRALKARLEALQQSGELETDLEEREVELRAYLEHLRSDLGRQGQALMEARSALDAAKEDVVVAGTLRPMSVAERIERLEEELRATKVQGTYAYREVEAAESQMRARAIQAEFEHDQRVSEAFQIQRTRLSLGADELTLELALPEASGVRIELFDLAGRRVLAKDVQLSAGVPSVRLDVSGLASGMYIYRARMDDGTYTTSHRLTIAR